MNQRDSSPRYSLGKNRPNQQYRDRKKNTSWQKVAGWYNQLVGEKGSYYHTHTVIPQSLALLNLKRGDHLLDLGCGQGVLSRHIPEGVAYTGIDASPELIRNASLHEHSLQKKFLVADVSKPLIGKIGDHFSHVVVMLALQNIENAEGVIENAKQVLKTKGKLLLVLNHPCFRIPRQSGWNADTTHGKQTRWVSAYLSPQRIPITMDPGSLVKQKHVTWSFHLPISEYSRLLQRYGFVIEKIEEWASDKESKGEHAKMENIARNEIPLFMAILASKIEL